MEKITKDHPAAQSANIVAAHIARLKELFPDAVTEGRIDFEVLRQLLGDEVDDREEKYGLNWNGKRRARQLALTPSLGTLRPCPEESVDWDTTKNIFIEGDNLEVLKLLQKSYAGKVKLIYIDPPYNTGSDFVYKDDFQDNIKNYQMLIGARDSDGRAIEANVESSGRFHTDWLNMAYPRMRIARNLLNELGVIFVSVDDTEVANLRLLMDDIFGPENFVSSISWKKRSSPDARATIGSTHDWLLCYVRSMPSIKQAIGKMPLSEDRVGAYSNPDDDPRGEWASVDMTGMTGRATKDQFFKVVSPSGREIFPPEGRSWGLSEQTYNELRADNRIWFGKTGDNVPRIKKFLSESDGQVVPSTWDMNDCGSNDEAKKEVNELMGASDVFDTPKPTRLLERLLQIATHEKTEHIVLDFFAGSGSMGHAVFSQCLSDSIRRKFILVQLPELLDASNKRQLAAADFCKRIGKASNIAELTKERLRRAGAKLREENPLFSGDLGFRVFKLDSSNIRAWNGESDNVEGQLDLHINHLVDGRTEQDVLYELLLKLGLDLCVPIEERTIAGKTVHSIGGGVLMACLGTSIGKDELEPLGQGIVAWHKEQAPTGESQVVFRDSAFEDDVAKTNMTAILEQNGIKTVRSL